MTSNVVSTGLKKNRKLKNDKMKKSILILCVLLMAAIPSACTESHKTPPELDKPQPGPNPDPKPEPSEGKEKMLWFDAEANFQRFSTQAGIIAMLDKTQEAGFNKIVVDVKPVEGDVLYKSEFMTQATTIGSVNVADRGWDYLQFFLDEAHKRNLKVTVSTTVFPMGMPSTRQGPAYRGTTWKGKTCMQYKPEGMVDIKDDPTKVAAFLNPVLPEVQEFALRFIREIVTNYDFDAYALDYCRFPDYQSDFSEASKEAFEKYIGGLVETWPGDVFTYNASGERVPGKYYKEWWEFRSMIIHDFVARVRTLGVRSITTRPVSPISSTRSCWGPTCPACTDPTTASRSNTVSTVPSASCSTPVPITRRWIARRRHSTSRKPAITASNARPG